MKFNTFMFWAQLVFFFSIAFGMFYMAEYYLRDERYTMEFLRLVFFYYTGLGLLVGFYGLAVVHISIWLNRREYDNR